MLSEISHWCSPPHQVWGRSCLAHNAPHHNNNVLVVDLPTPGCARETKGYGNCLILQCCHYRKWPMPTGFRDSAHQPCPTPTLHHHTVSSPPFAFTVWSPHSLQFRPRRTTKKKQRCVRGHPPNLAITHRNTRVDSLSFNFFFFGILCVFVSDYLGSASAGGIAHKYNLKFPEFSGQPQTTPTV